MPCEAQFGAVVMKYECLMVPSRNRMFMIPGHSHLFKLCRWLRAEYRSNSLSILERSLC